MMERRRYIRIPETVEITYRKIPEVKSSQFLTKDVGEGGVRFFVHKFLPKGSLLRVRIKFEKEAFCVEAIVRVRWIRNIFNDERFEIGVEFIEIPLDALNKLKYYIFKASRSTK